MRIFHIFLLFFTCFCLSITISAHQHSGQCNDSISWEFNASTGILHITGTGEMPDYNWMLDRPWNLCTSNIKKIIIDSGITSISNKAFWGCSSLTEVYLPENLQRIEADAFGGCSNLSIIELPNSIKEIGNKAFYECFSMSLVNIPSEIENIGASAFYRTNIIEAHLPDSLINLGDNAFAGCQALKSVNLSNSITTINSGTFSGCILLSEINLPQKIENINSHAFKGCKSLTKITLPNNIKVISPSVFANCSSLSEIDMPDSVIIIGNSAFSGCSSLKRINLNKVMTIRENAFWSCSSLKEITIPSNTTHIYNYAFSNCPVLETIRIPSNVSYMDADVFKGSDNVVICGEPNSYAEAYAKYNLIPFSHNDDTSITMSTVTNATISYITSEETRSPTIATEKVETTEANIDYTSQEITIITITEVIENFPTAENTAIKTEEYVNSSSTVSTSTENDSITIVTGNPDSTSKLSNSSHIKIQLNTVLLIIVIALLIINIAILLRRKTK